MADKFFQSAAKFLKFRVAAFRQTPMQTFHRKPGDRFLTGPFCVRDDAIELWQFARLSEAAYTRSALQKTAPTRRGLLGWILGKLFARKPSAETVAQANAKLAKVHALLADHGWTPWPDFPDPELAHEMSQSHLRAEIWQNSDRSKIVAAFGGTVFTSGKDWKSNLRWFFLKKNDEYTQIVNIFGPDFKSNFYSIHDQSPYLNNLTIYSTGHSLGGGLAQQFAYSLPEIKLDNQAIKVAKVYAFDPSPVTGFYSVDRKVRDYNKLGLDIIRIYERGEVLAILRSLTSALFKPTRINACITGVRFSLFRSRTPIAGHSIAELAQRMEAAANLPCCSTAANPADGPTSRAH